MLQVQSNLLQCRVIRSAQLESTALGAAYFAGLAIGFWRDEAEIASNWKSDLRFEPRAQQADVQGLQAAWKKGLMRAKNWNSNPFHET
jgi:glycerol kinase